MRKCGAHDECCCDAMRRKSSTLSDSGRNASAVTEDDGFVPRRSTHVTGPTNADGDTWQESLAVCELAGKLTIRSFFSNQRTQERIWDEPPSGASHVVNASDVMRKMAKIQLQEMQIAIGTVPDVEQSTPKSKRGFGGFFRRSKGDASTPPAESRMQHRPDSFLGRSKRDHKNSPMYDEHLDPAMQRALVSSMSSKNRSSAHYHDADLERAMALSLLEAETANPLTNNARPESSSSRLRSPSSDGNRSNSRGKHRASSGRHGSHGFQEISAKEGSASPDRQRHRSVAWDGTQRRKGHLQNGHSSLQSEGTKPRADPPSDVNFYESVDDGSIVHYQFSHDDQEALAIALSLSLLDVSPPRTNTGVASMPEASEMTEEEQLTKAMEESLAMSPPELQYRPEASAIGAFKSAWGDRKTPAGGVATDVYCADILNSLVHQSPPESTTNDCAGLQCLESVLPADKDEFSFSKQRTPRRLDVQRSPSDPRMSGSTAQAQARRSSHQDEPLAMSSVSQLQLESRERNTKEALYRSGSPNPRTQANGSPTENWFPRSPKENRSPQSPTDNRSPQSPVDEESSNRSLSRERWLADYD